MALYGAGLDVFNALFGSPSSIWASGLHGGLFGVVLVVLWSAASVCHNYTLTRATSTKGSDPLVRRLCDALAACVNVVYVAFSHLYANSILPRIFSL